MSLYESAVALAALNIFDNAVKEFNKGGGGTPEEFDVFLDFEEYFAEPIPEEKKNGIWKFLEIFKKEYFSQEEWMIVLRTYMGSGSATETQLIGTFPSRVATHEYAIEKGIQNQENYYHHDVVAWTPLDN